MVKQRIFTKQMLTLFLSIFMICSCDDNNNQRNYESSQSVGSQGYRLELRCLFVNSVVTSASCLPTDASVATLYTENSSKTFSGLDLFYKMDRNGAVTLEVPEHFDFRAVNGGERFTLHLKVVDIATGKSIYKDEASGKYSSVSFSR